MATRSKLLEDIHAKSVIYVIPEIEDLILEHGELVLFEPEERVCQQGKKQTHYFMPVSHPLRMIQNNQEGTTESFLGYN